MSVRTLPRLRSVDSQMVSIQVPVASAAPPLVVSQEIVTASPASPVAGITWLVGCRSGSGGLLMLMRLEVETLLESRLIVYALL